MTDYEQKRPLRQQDADLRIEVPLGDRSHRISRTSASGGRVCRLCGAVITGRRRNGFCGDRCRMRLKRQQAATTSTDRLPMLLTATDVADLLRTSRNAVYAMVERDQLPGVIRIGRRLRFRRDTLVDWINQKSAPSQKESRR